MVKNIKNSNKTSVKQNVNVKVNIGEHKRKNNKKKVNRKRKPTGGVSTHNPSYLQPFNPVYIQSGNAPHLEPSTPPNLLTNSVPVSIPVSIPSSVSQVIPPPRTPTGNHTFHQDNPLRLSKIQLPPKPPSLLSQVKSTSISTRPVPPPKTSEHENIYTGGGPEVGGSAKVDGGAAGGGEKPQTAKQLENELKKQEKEAEKVIKQMEKEKEKARKQMMRAEAPLRQRPLESPQQIMKWAETSLPSPLKPPHTSPSHIRRDEIPLPSPSTKKAAAMLKAKEKSKTIPPVLFKGEPKLGRPLGSKNKPKLKEF